MPAQRYGRAPWALAPGGTTIMDSNGVHLLRESGGLGGDADPILQRAIASVNLLADLPLDVIERAARGEIDLDAAIKARRAAKRGAKRAGRLS